MVCTRVFGHTFCRAYTPDSSRQALVCAQCEADSAQPCFSCMGCTPPFMCSFCLQGMKGKQFFYLMEIFFGMETTEGKVPGVQVGGGGARESGGRLQGGPRLSAGRLQGGPRLAARGQGLLLALPGQGGVGTGQGPRAQPSPSPSTAEQGIAGPCSPLPRTWTRAGCCARCCF